MSDRGGPVPITPEGARALQDELDHLWRVERRKVTAEVAAAAAQGDRSENAEYIYGKRRLREIDRRIRFLRQRLDRLHVVRTGEVADPGRVYFGAWVRLEDADTGEERTYRLVGPDEFDLERGLLSVASPLGRALLGQAIGATVSVERPDGRVEYTVLELSYAAPGTPRLG